MASSTPQSQEAALTPEARQRIEQLVQQVKAEPENPVPLLQLAQAYAQIWAKTSSPDVFSRVARCLERAADLDVAKYAGQVKQILDFAARHAHNKNLHDAAKALQDLAARFQARLGGGGKSGAAAPMAQPAAPGGAPALGPSPFAPRPAPASASPAAPPPGAAKPRMARDGGAAPSGKAAGATAFAENMMTLGGEMDGGDEDLLAYAEESEEMRRESQALALASAQLTPKIDEMFEKDQVSELLEMYAGLTDGRPKRYIIDRFAAKIADYEVGPLLAVGAMEGNEQIFRHVMRTLLRCDRATICQQIDLEQLSPDLRRVGAVVLSKLGLRAALPKLQKGLEIEDPFVRCVALHGLSRGGDAALEYIGVLVDAARGDPDPNVRLEAARAIKSMDRAEAYDALETMAVQTRLDPVVLKVLEEMRLKFDPDGSGLERKVAKFRKTADKSKSITSQKIEDAERLLQSQRETMQRMKEGAAPDGEVPEDVQKKKDRTARIVVAGVAVLVALLLAYKAWGPIYRLFRAAYGI